MANSVGVEAVQQIIAAKQYYKANHAMVVTNNIFTPAAKKMANQTKVELWDGKALKSKMSNYF